MNRQPVCDALGRIERLGIEINDNISSERPQLADFRSDLAGLLAVTTCATYENCVKMILQEYAVRQHSLFGVYAENQYEKINSRIEIADLHKYAKTFHPTINANFKSKLDAVKAFYLDRISLDIVAAYSQLLRWRHSFAHTGARLTTVEEVLQHHRLAKRVIVIFLDAFAEYPPS